MRLHHLILLFSIIGSETLGQSSMEAAKKSIKTYLYKNLHDFKSYEPIEYSELKKVYSQLEEDSKYQINKKFIEDITAQQEQLVSKIDLYKNRRIKNLEMQADEIKSEIEKLNNIFWSL